MEFTNEFAVPTDSRQAWSVLTDVPRIAPCLPGATVEPLGGDSYSGTVAVKVGPIKAAYSGTATFRELDPDALHMVLDAQGKEASGKGSASATVSVTLHEEGADKTQVRIHTDLQVTGKLAQFGRNAMADVGARLIAQFAANLEGLLGPERSNTPAPDTQDVPVAPVPDRATAAAPKQQPGAELDAFALVAPVLKRVAPTVAAFVLGATLTWLAGRLRRSPAPRRRAGRYEYAPS